MNADANRVIATLSNTIADLHVQLAVAKDIISQYENAAELAPTEE